MQEKWLVYFYLRGYDFIRLHSNGWN